MEDGGPTIKDYGSTAFYFHAKVAWRTIRDYESDNVDNWLDT